jgi:hypothetical protein
MFKRSTLRATSTFSASALTLVLVGCTSAPSEPTPVPTVTVTTTVTATATVTATPRPATATPAATSTAAASAPVSTIPSPDAQQEALLVAALNEVDPALVGDDGVVNHSRDQCSSILGGASQESLIASTKLRFETATFTPSDAQASQILDAIEQSGFCVG